VFDCGGMAFGEAKLIVGMSSKLSRVLRFWPKRRKDYPSGTRVMGYLEPHQTIRVLQMGYGKDFQAFRVITSDGTTGWVVAGDAVKVVALGE
jgi:hypothetical protein